MSPVEPWPAGQDTRLPTPKHTSGSGGSHPQLCLPPPLCVPAARGHGLNSIVTLQCSSTVIATRKPGVEGAALPHDGDEAEVGVVLGGCGRRELPPPRPARLFPPPARGRRLLSAPPEEMQHPAGSGRGSLLSPIPGPGRGLPTPGSSRPPPDRSPSPARDQTAPFLRAQTPPGEAGQAGGGGALLLGGPGRPTIPAGLCPGPGRAAAPGAVHGGGAVRGDRCQRRCRCLGNRSSARGRPATPLAGSPRRWPRRGQWAAPRQRPRPAPRPR